MSGRPRASTQNPQQARSLALAPTVAPTLALTGILALAGALAPKAARAAVPVGDRGMLTHSAALVSGNTVEIQTGGRWSQGFEAPACMKYSFAGVFEPALSLDLAHSNTERPGLVAAGKVRILADKAWALSGYAASAVPIHAGEPWHSTARVLLDATMASGAEVRLNGGVDLGATPEGGVGTTGIPLSTALLVPITRSWGARAELSTVVRDGASDWVLSGGLQWRVTEIATIDAGPGWDLDNGQPFIQAGVSANLGHPGG